ncbi:MAG: glycosyltransferase family 2 protein [Paludibacteraceae bacterium]|nr:glycosyltransferase family 2 protein [Paludibacteraceae bacterium]
MIRVAVVILNWNGRKYLEKYLPSVVRYSSASDIEIWVADNGSTDDSVEWLAQNMPEVKVLKLSKNYGFAEGYNIAIEKINSEYTVLLNSDVEVTQGWLDEPIRYLEEHQRASAVQPKILQMNDRKRFEFAGAAGGYIDALGYPFCKGRMLKTLEEDHGQYDKMAPVFWASGACLIIRREDFVDYGGFDPQFFAHQEEIDLCWRLQSRGKYLVYMPQSVVYHVGGGSLSADNPFKTYLNYRNNLLMVYKNAPASRLWWMMLLRFLTDWLSIVLYLLQFKPKMAAAAIKGRWHYHTMRRKCRPSRAENREHAIVNNIQTQWHGILPLHYYLFFGKTFQTLHFVPKVKNLN